MRIRAGGKTIFWVSETNRFLAKLRERQVSSASPFLRIGFFINLICPKPISNGNVRNGHVINRIKRIMNRIPEELLEGIQVCCSERIVFVMPFRERGIREYSGIQPDDNRVIMAEIISFPLNMSTNDVRDMICDGITKVSSCHQDKLKSCGPDLIVIVVEDKFLREVCSSVYPEYLVQPAAISVNLDGSIINQINLFFEEYENRRSGSEYVLRSLNYQIVVSLLRNINGSTGDVNAKNRPNKTDPKKCFEKENITRAIKYLQKHVAGNFSLKKVSKVANLSPYHFIRVFKAYTGKTPYDYFLDIKVGRARELLIRENKSVTEVCYLCGFNNLSHFTALFKKRVGLSPSVYRKNLLNRI